MEPVVPLASSFLLTWLVRECTKRESRFVYLCEEPHKWWSTLNS